MEVAPKALVRKTTTRIKLRKCDETSGENPEKSVVSFFRSRANGTTPRYQLRKLSRVTID